MTRTIGFFSYGLIVAALVTASLMDAALAKGAGPTSAILYPNPSVGNFTQNVVSREQLYRYSYRDRQARVDFAWNHARIRFLHSDESLCLEFVATQPSTEISGSLPREARTRFYQNESLDKTIPLFQQIEYSELYTGIDLVFQSGPRGLKREFHLKPGIDPDQIRFRYPEATHVEITQTGELKVETHLGTIVESAPVSFQPEAKSDRFVSSGYVIHTDGSIGFNVDSLDPMLPLVIDPEFSFLSKLGGSGDDVAFDVDWTDHGIFVVGTTESMDFASEPGPSDRGTDIVVTRLDSTTQEVLYTTIVGGSGTDFANGIRVDSTGHAFVSGWTDSSDFPTLAPIQDALNGPTDGVILELDPHGDIVFSTYFGGSGEDQFSSIDMFRDSAFNNADDSIALTGFSNSSDFPFPANPSTRVDSTCNCSNGNTDAVVVYLNNDNTLRWSAFLGGGASEIGLGVTIDRRGQPFVGGWTNSRNFPKAPFQQLKGGRDGFVSGFESSDGARFVSEMVGGSEDDLIEDLISLANNAILAVGTTESADLNARDAFQETYGGGPSDGLIVRVDPNKTGSKLREISFLGGSDLDQIRGISNTGLVLHLAGNTSSTDFPLLDALQTSYGGGETDAWLARFGAQIQAFNGLLTLEQQFTTLLGGEGADGLTALSTPRSSEDDESVALAGASNSTEAPPFTRAPAPAASAPGDSILVGTVKQSANPFDYAIETHGQATYEVDISGSPAFMTAEFEIFLNTPDVPSDSLGPIELTILHPGEMVDIEFFAESNPTADPTQLVSTLLTEGINCMLVDPNNTLCTINSDVLPAHRNRLIVRVVNTVSTEIEPIIGASISGDGDDPNMPNNFAAAGATLSDIELSFEEATYRTALTNSNGPDFGFVPADPKTPIIEVDTKLRVTNNGPSDSGNFSFSLVGPQRDNALEIQQVTVLNAPNGVNVAVERLLPTNDQPSQSGFECRVSGLAVDQSVELELRSALMQTDRGRPGSGAEITATVTRLEERFDPAPDNNTDTFFPTNADGTFSPEPESPSDEAIAGLDVSITIVDSFLTPRTRQRTTVFNVENTSTEESAPNTFVTIFRDDRVDARTTSFRRFSPDIALPNDTFDCGQSLTHHDCALGTLLPRESVRITVVDELNRSLADQSNLEGLEESVEIRATVIHDARDVNTFNNLAQGTLDTRPDVVVHKPQIDVVTIGRDPDRPSYAIRTRVSLENQSAFRSAINPRIFISQDGELDVRRDTVTLVEGLAVLTCEPFASTGHVCTIDSLEPLERITIEVLNPIQDLQDISAIFSTKFSLLLNGDANSENDVQEESFTYFGVADIRLSLVSCEEIEVESTSGTQRALRSKIRVENNGPLEAISVSIVSLADPSLIPSTTFSFLPSIGSLNTDGNTINTLEPGDEVIYQTTAIVPQGVRVFRQNLGAKVTSSLSDDPDSTNNQVNSECVSIEFTGTKIRQNTSSTTPEVVITFPSTDGEIYVLETTLNLANEFQPLREITGNGETIELTLPAENQQGFIRIRTQLP